MKITMLTVADPLYLPAFFDLVLAELAGGGHDVEVYAAPALYRGQTTLSAAWRYLRTFGIDGFVGLALRMLRAKCLRISIEQSCRWAGVPYAALADVNHPPFLERLRNTGTDLIVSVSCPQIFRGRLINLPRHGCLNIHGAILPAYRGVMPGFWMLANRERQAGVSIFFVNEGIDTGDLCGQVTFAIDPYLSLDAFLRLSKEKAARLLLEVINRLERGVVCRTPIDQTRGSYFRWPDRQAVRIFKQQGGRLW